MSSIESIALTPTAAQAAAKDRADLIRHQAAVRAVFNLHRPGEYGDCIECGVSVHEDPIPYPCDTVNAITAELAAKP